jgi:hypothetical protein
MTPGEQRGLQIVAVLNAMAAVVWILILFDRTARRGTLTDYGPALGLPALFVLIPLGGIGVWRLTRGRKPPLDVRRRLYLWLSGLFLAATWVLSLVPAVFWGGLLGLQVTYLWPVNLREGPDTSFARELFQEHFRITGDGIDDLYCRRGWEFGDGNTYRMRFHFRDAAALERVVRAVGAEPLVDTGGAFWIIEADPPAWWPGPSFTGYQRVFRVGESRPRLWVDDANRIAYYRSWP